MDSKEQQFTSVPLDMATPGYWERLWKHAGVVPSVSRLNYYDFRLRTLLDPLAREGGRVLEVGCGGSRWLAYFDQARRCETWGIDYSAGGLELTRRNLLANHPCRLVQGDFFDRSLLPKSYFDFIYSLGFVEHFSETSVVTKRIAELLRLGGRVMTLIPNLVSTYGRLQKYLDQDIYNKHVVMDCATLDRHHAAAGLSPVMPARYYGCFAPGVVNFAAWEPKFFGLGRLVLPAVRILQHSVCWALHALHCDFESRRASPYIVGIYEKN